MLEELFNEKSNLVIKIMTELGAKLLFLKLPVYPSSGATNKGARWFIKINVFVYILY